MRISLAELKIGDVLGGDIYNLSGLHLLPTDKIISEEDRGKLLKHNIDYIEIKKDEISVSKYRMQTLYPKHLQIYKNAIQGIRDLFQSVRTEGIISKDFVNERYSELLLKFEDEQDLLSFLLHLNKKDEYTYEHCVQVGIFSYFIATWLGLDKEEAILIGETGYLHDIGKGKVDNAILLKPDRLTNDEFTEMKKHTTYGFEILQESLGDNNIFAIVALEHHERLNGSGYPLQKNCDDIHFYSKIVAVADIFDAMTSNRVYQERKNLLYVLRELHRMSFGELDATITHTFIKNLLPHLIGKKVALNNGQTGTIVMTNLLDFFRPLIQLDDEFLDLSVHTYIDIVSILMD